MNLSDQRKISPFTSREIEILACVAQGHANKEIAAMPCLSEKTVRNHITHILKKLRLTRRPQLVCYAWRMGWVTKDEGKEAQ